MTNHTLERKKVHILLNCIVKTKVKIQFFFDIFVISTQFNELIRISLIQETFSLMTSVISQGAILYHTPLAVHAYIYIYIYIHTHKYIF